MGVAVLGAEHGPEEAAEFAGDGDLGFVAGQAPGQQAGEAQVEAVLSFPAQGADLWRLALLTAGEFLTHLGRPEVMLGAFG